jgi:uncharacterized Zn finger protein
VVSRVGLGEVLDEELLAGLAGPRSFARGMQYASDGAVGRLRVVGDVVEATVQGSHAYRVRLGVDAGGQVECSCSCPTASDGACCKHCVAVGLRWLQGDPGGVGPDEQELRAYLHGLGVDGLVDLVVEQAGTDQRFGERLSVRALRAADGAAVLGSVRALLDRAMRVRDYVDYREAWGFFQAVDEAIDAVADLLEEGHADEVVELCEYAVWLVDGLVGEVDDSDGGTMDALARLEELHLTACEGSAVDPVVLAERLFSMAMASELDAFSEAPQRYAEILGPAGLGRFDELVEAAWAKGEDDDEDGDGAWLLESWAEQLARQAGDVDRLVAIKSRNLTSDVGYQQIVEVLVEAERHEEALGWAQRGLAATPVHHQPWLQDFVASTYRAGGRIEEAVALRAEQLRDTPSLQAYQALKDDADALGAWLERREAALAQLRDAAMPSGKVPRWGRHDRSTLVEIFLWEGEVGAAWEEAQAGGCSETLWRGLAAARVKDRPQDTVAVYRKLVGQTVGATNNNAYEHAIELLVELEQALPEHAVNEHGRLVAEVRELYRRKRNFAKLLDQRWPSSASA